MRDKYLLGIIAFAFALLTLATAINLSYLYCVPLFALFGVAACQIAVKKVESINHVGLVITMCSIMGSLPIRRIYELDGLLVSLTTTLAYAAFLWVAAFGWRRKWA